MSEQMPLTPSNSADPVVLDKDKGQTESAPVELGQTLSDAIFNILTQQGYPIDNVRLQDVVNKHSRLSERQGRNLNDLGAVVAVLQGIGIEDQAEILEQPDAAFLPLIAYRANYGWGVIDAQNPQGTWNFRQADINTSSRTEDLTLILRIRLTDDHVKKRSATFSSLLRSNLGSYKAIVIEAVVASFLINFLALAVSLFSMQVYDRVIPTRSEYTLIILASGVALIIFFEAFMKFARSRIMDKVVVGLDQYLSREVFQRLLKVRIDQMPGSVGSMAAQLRGYEQVRSFFTASTLFGLVDLPMTIIFVTLIAFIASPLVALVPVIAGVIAIVMGLTARKRIDQIAAEGASASYYKTGLLVEAVEGVETIKAGAGSWKFLSRWLDVMDITIKNDLDMKHANDNLTYFTQMLQQVSYVGIVIVGSFVVMSGDMTIGGLIASSILGGRVLAPVMGIPNLLVQYAHAKAAKLNIENLFDLQQDNHGVSYPLSPSKVNGQFNCDDVAFNYEGNDRPAVVVPKLIIRPGERIAILGPIGSGKSTLLKMLAGLYAPSKGRILLDGLDIQQISRETLSERLGYLQQDHRLFQGTLRENLLIGMAAPSDDLMHEVLVKTGLINLVSSHSSGLDLPISEGGRGLSGGQKQLVAFTRLLLTKPNVFLLDEPTASMDNRQEQRCLQVLKEELEEGQTFVVSTHKTALLDLVDRLIIMDNQRIVMDGPKQDILNQLMNNEQTKISAAPQHSLPYRPDAEDAPTEDAPSPQPSGPTPVSGTMNTPIKIQPVSAEKTISPISSASSDTDSAAKQATGQTSSNVVDGSAVERTRASDPIKINRNKQRSGDTTSQRAPQTTPQTAQHASKQASPSAPTNAEQPAAPAQSATASSESNTAGPSITMPKRAAAESTQAPPTIKITPRVASAPLGGEGNKASAAGEANTTAARTTTASATTASATDASGNSTVSGATPAPQSETTSNHNAPARPASASTLTNAIKIQPRRLGNAEQRSRATPNTRMTRPQPVSAPPSSSRSASSAQDGNLAKNGDTTPEASSSPASDPKKTPSYDGGALTSSSIDTGDDIGKIQAPQHVKVNSIKINPTTRNNAADDPHNK